MIQRCHVDTCTDTSLNSFRFVSFRFNLVSLFPCLPPLRSVDQEPIVSLVLCALRLSVIGPPRGPTTGFALLISLFVLLPRDPCRYSVTRARTFDIRIAHETISVQSKLVSTPLARSNPLRPCIRHLISVLLPRDSLVFLPSHSSDASDSSSILALIPSNRTTLTRT